MVQFAILHHYDGINVRDFISVYDIVFVCFKYRFYVLQSNTHLGECVFVCVWNRSESLSNECDGFFQPHGRKNSFTRKIMHMIARDMDFYIFFPSYNASVSVLNIARKYIYWTTTAPSFYICNSTQFCSNFTN